EHLHQPADLRIKHRDQHARLVAGVRLVTGAASVVLAGLDAHRRPTLGTPQHAGQCPDPRVTAHAAAGGGAPRSGLLGTFEDVDVDRRRVLAREPLLTIWQLTEVEAVLEQRPDRVLAERVLAPVPGRAKAGAGEGDRDVPV